jgi:hypothetical protein
MAVQAALEKAPAQFICTSLLIYLLLPHSPKEKHPRTKSSSPDKYRIEGKVS